MLLAVLITSSVGCAVLDQRAAERTQALGAAHKYPGPPAYFSRTWSKSHAAQTRIALARLHRQ